MMITLLACLLAQAPLEPGAQLPPGHPPLNAQPGAPQVVPAGPLPPGAEGAPLPPNHPSLGAPQQPPAQEPLPPNHPSLGGGSGGSGQAPTMEDLMRRLDADKSLPTREKTFELADSIGRLYYGQGRFKDARLYFEQAVQKAEPVRALYLAKKKAAGAAVLPAPETVDCAPGAQPAMDALFKKAQAAKTPAAAAACALAALQPAREVAQMLGNAKFLERDADGAIAVYSRTLELFPDDAEARYARAAAVLDTKGGDVKALKAAEADFERFLSDGHGSPRAPQARRMLDRTRAAIKAGGVSKIPLAVGPTRPPVVAQGPMQGGPMQGGPMQGGPMQGGPMQAGATQGGPMQGGPMQAGATQGGPMQGGPMQGGPMQGGPMQGGPMQGGPMQGGMQGGPQVDSMNVSPQMMEAFKNTKVTPELEAQLVKRLDEAEEDLARGRYDSALAGYRQVMPFRPEPRVQAGMAWTLIKLGKPTGERVWMVASQDPDAISALGDTLKAKGDGEGAKQVWKRLAETVPAYAPRLQGKL